jgi:hypothetical protein
MEDVSKAKVALKKVLIFEQQHLERDMKESEDEIQMSLEQWRMRKKEILELEESIKFQKVVRTAKIAISGRLAAAELLKYGVSHHVFHYLMMQACSFIIHPTGLPDHC